MITADIHTHTHYFHGKNTVQEMYHAASEKNLKYYGFSEHTPLPQGFSCLLYREGDMDEAFRNYIKDVLALKEEVKKYNEAAIYKKPEVLLGMELDFTPHDFGYMENLIQSYPFDYVIGTIHFVGEQNIGLWNTDAASQKEKFDFFTQYYDYIRQLAKWGKADIIAHPDFVKIHCIDDFHTWLDTAQGVEVIQETCKTIKESGMVLEVSTGGLNKACKEIHPSPKIMEIVSAHQIPISFASDTHNINTVCYRFDELADFARSYGYQNHTIFVNRKPVVLEF